MLLRVTTNRIPQGKHNAYITWHGILIYLYMSTITAITQVPNGLEDNPNMFAYRYVCRCRHAGRQAGLGGIIHSMRCSTFDTSIYHHLLIPCLQRTCTTNPHTNYTYIHSIFGMLGLSMIFQGGLSRFLLGRQINQHFLQQATKIQGMKVSGCNT